MMKAIEDEANLNTRGLFTRSPNLKFEKSKTNKYQRNVYAERA